MAYLGDFTLGDTLDFKFSTVGTTGAPTTLAGSPVISAYVGNSTTQITAGITLTVDFDAVTGLHNCRVVASAGNGYAAQTNVDLVITTGTVGGTSVVGYVVGSFSIENRSTQLLATAANLATLAGYVDTEVAAIKTVTDALSPRLPGSGTISTLDAAGVRTAVGLASANLDTQLTAIDDFLDTEVAAIKAKTDLIPASPAAVSDIPTAVQNADALLGRNVSGGSSTGRTVKQVFHFIRNRWVVAAGTLTVYDTDDTTTSWTAAVTGTAGADPVTGVDP